MGTVILRSHEDEESHACLQHQEAPRLLPQSWQGFLFYTISLSLSLSLCFTALSCFVVAIMSYVLLVCRESRERKMGNREFAESLGFCFLVHAMTKVYDAFLRS